MIGERNFASRIRKSGVRRQSTARRSHAGRSRGGARTETQDPRSLGFQALEEREIRLPLGAVQSAVR